MLEVYKTKGNKSALNFHTVLTFFAIVFFCMSIVMIYLVLTAPEKSKQNSINKKETVNETDALVLARNINLSSAKSLSQQSVLGSTDTLTEVDLTKLPLNLPTIELSNTVIDPALAINYSATFTFASNLAQNIAAAPTPTEQVQVTPTVVRSASNSISSAMSTSAKVSNIFITNKDFKRWTVTWITDKQTIGSVKWGTTKDSLTNIAVDDRDTTASQNKYFTHTVSILNPDAVLNGNLDNLKLYFVIVNDGVETYDSGNVAFVYENAPLLSFPSTPTSTIVELQNPVIGNDAVIVASLVDPSGQVSQSVSATFKSNDSAIIPLGTMRNSGLSNYVDISGSGTLSLKLYYADKVLEQNNISLSGIEDKQISLANSVTQTTTAATNQVNSTGAKVSGNPFAANYYPPATAIISNSSSRSAAKISTTVNQVPKTGIKEDVESIKIILSFGALFVASINIYLNKNFIRRKLFEIKLK